MTKPFQQWTVLPHDELTRVDDNILSVTGTLRMPTGDFDRRMTIVRLSDGRLVVYSAIALGVAEMREVEAFGTPSFLIVPNAIHRMDAKIWKDRYPTMTVVAPQGARDKVDAIVAVDATTVDFGDPRVRFVSVPGTGDREAALLVETNGGTTLIVNDLIFNVQNGPGLGGWILKAIGMTGDAPRLPPLVKMREVEDKEALRDQLEAWAHLPDLKRVIVSHGAIIANDPARVLGRIAADLRA